MNQKHYDLTPLKEGEESDLAIQDDQCYTIEDLATIFSGRHKNSDCDDVIFKEELSVLKCGLVVLKKELSLFRNPPPDVLADIEQVMAIAEHFDGTEWVGAVSSRFAPVLFCCQSANDPIEVALHKVLNVVDEGLTVTDCDFRRIFINGRMIFKNDTFCNVPHASNEEQLIKRLLQTDAIDNEDFTPCFPRLLTGIMVEDNVYKEHVTTANRLFGQLQNVKKISLGVFGTGAEAEIKRHNTPVFQIGFTANDRLGGLLCNHVD